jgi:hypothetical protein
MRMSRIGVTLFGAALLFSGSAFAGNGNDNKGKLRLDEKVSVDGTPLAAGSYNVAWTGTGSDVQVTLTQGKNTVATFPAHVAEQPNASQSNGYGSTSQPNGDRSLTAIYFGGKRYSLQVEPASASQPNQNNSAAK